MHNHFDCKGKLAGCYDRRVTPGGVILEDLVLAIPTAVPWKEKRTMHLRMTCCGDTAEFLKKLSTGDIICTKGMIEETGVSDNKKIRLIVTEIIKE